MAAGVHISIKQLTKRYPGTAAKALDNVSMHIGSGEIYGFLGANGAGKTTTIRLLMNFLQPTAGSASIMGLDVVRQAVAVKKHVGYLAGDLALYPKVTGRELLDYLSALQGGRDAVYFKKLVERFAADLDKPIGDLSKGNRQKIGILQAVMHRPDVLILDEPTSGLDPLMQEAFYETLREAKAHGAAILMSSHNLSEAQGLCDRIGIIRHGKLAHEQTVSGTDKLGGAVYRVTLAHTADVARLQANTAVKVVSILSNGTLLLQPARQLNGLLHVLSKFDVQALSSEQINLEDEFLQFYGDQST